MWLSSSSDLTRWDCNMHTNKVGGTCSSYILTNIAIICLKLKLSTTDGTGAMGIQIANHCFAASTNWCSRPHSDLYRLQLSMYNTYYYIVHYVRYSPLYDILPNALLYYLTLHLHTSVNDREGFSKHLTHDGRNDCWLRTMQLEIQTLLYQLLPCTLLLRLLPRGLP